MHKEKKPLIMVCARLFEDEWEIFKEICGDRKANKRLRELITAEIARFTKEENDAIANQM